MYVHVYVTFVCIEPQQTPLRLPRDSGSGGNPVALLIEVAVFCFPSFSLNKLNKKRWLSTALRGVICAPLLVVTWFLGLFCALPLVSLGRYVVALGYCVPFLSLLFQPSPWVKLCPLSLVSSRSLRWVKL